MDILKDYIQTEFTVKGSRFLSELFPCENQADARNLIKAQKTKYADATHVVHAFVVGKGAEVLGMSDDGEPSGTAGRPALDVLKGSDCTNFILTVTRWFGGTLLGTGGLVKAYSNGAKGAVENAIAKSLIVPLVQKKEFNFNVDYNLYKLLKIKMEKYNIFDLSEDFSTDIKINGKIEEGEYISFKDELKNLSNGKIVL